MTSGAAKRSSIARAGLITSGQPKVQFAASAQLAVFLAAFCLCGTLLQAAPGTVYLVLGSDTAIWNSADQTTVAVAPFSEYFPPDLYTNRARNAYTVFDSAFRNQFVDSYGTPLQLTWWAMGGNMFRYAANTDAGPCDNSMILYLLKTFHGTGLRQFGDQLSYHWHNFYWTGSQWAQSSTFEQCQDDFDFTMAQYLLEEGIYPMSFRTGWEWNSNPYQNHINLFIPFTLSAYWLTTSVPYHPSSSNYRVAGDLTGWEVWDSHMKNVTQTRMNAMFAAAAGGQDQVACLWGHLPEPDFTNSIAGAHAKALVAASVYPAAKFRYCTATEAMQRWLGTTDQAAPRLDVTESLQGDTLSLTVHTDTAIFQAQPFVACKDKNNQTTIVPCASADANTWDVTLPVGRSNLARVAIAVSDATGHLATRILDYLTVLQGDTASFLLYAQGSPSLSYQWQHDSSPIAGATSSVLSITNAQLSDSGTYSVAVTNSSGDTYTEVANLVVSTAAPPPGQFSWAGIDGNGQFRLMFAGVAGSSYLVEASTNLVNWFPVTTTSFGSNALVFTDSATTNFPRRFYRARTMSAITITDFENYSPGTVVMYRTPSYSGTTQSLVDTSAACFAYVTNNFPAGHGGARVLLATWKFKAGSTNWLRLTDTDGAYVPNPAVDFGQGVQFDLYTDRALYVAVGLRETSTTAALGGNGGNSGLIEWVGGTTDNTTSPVKGRPVPAGQWTTLRYFFPYEPIKAFNGNGVLDSTTGKGAFEHLALVPVVSGADAYNVYLDNFQAIHITSP